MGFYDRYVLPWLLDFAMSRGRFRSLRPRATAEAAGEVLEIGFGTGLNLPHYGPRVERLTGLDPYDVLPRRVARRIAAAAFPVARVRAPAEHLPFADASFDTVVATWTLCSVDDPAAVLREAARVLRPGGRFLFLEHGRSENPRVARWQDRLTPWQRRLAGGCRLNRDVPALLGASGLVIERLERLRLPWTPAVLAEMVWGEGGGRG